MEYLNNSKVVAGVAMLMLNIGSRYVQADLGKAHEMLLSNEYVKKAIVFCMFFVATRDIRVAFLLTVFYIIIIDVALHDKKKFCLIPKRFLKETDIPDAEYVKAKDIVAAYEKKAEKTMQKDAYTNYISTLQSI